MVIVPEAANMKRLFRANTYLHLPERTYQDIYGYLLLVKASLALTASDLAAGGVIGFAEF